MAVANPPSQHPLHFDALQTDGSPVDRHEVLAVVLCVKDDALCALLWQHARGPAAGLWALPGGRLLADEVLGQSMARHLADKVDVRALAHLEQLETRSDPNRVPGHRVLATAYLGLLPTDQQPTLPSDAAWHPIAALPELAFDHESILRSGLGRLRAKLSYTNLGFALAPSEFTASELADVYRAALGHDVSATNLKRILLRREQIVPTGEVTDPGRSGGRPAARYRFLTRRIEVTDQFAVLRPPDIAPAGAEGIETVEAAEHGAELRA
jgi:ADP-ribose pyrophosphatase YjhB (NUDIX family)